jgi:hypothetical protein
VVPNQTLNHFKRSKNKVMKNKIKNVLLCVGLVIFFISCQKTISDMPEAENDLLSVSEKIVTPENATARRSIGHYKTFYGPAVRMGNGHVRSWANISHNDKVLAIGVEMTCGALDGLPQDPENFAASTFVLKLHQKAKALTPFDHIVVNWNVHGHEPDHVFDVAHFDFHFYKISLADQLAIPPYEIAPANFDANPPTDYMPPLYLHTPGGVPQMGAHWVDLLAPELNGGAFTHTFIYGSYDGNVNFLEPMVTLATIESGNTIHQDFRQPQKFSPTGKFYPSRYNIWKNNSSNNHYLSLDQMEWR